MSIMLNDPTVAAKLLMPEMNVKGRPATRAPASGPPPVLSDSLSAELSLTAPQQVSGAPPIQYVMYSSSETGGGVAKDHLQLFSYSSDGTYGAAGATVTQEALDIYPTAQGSICAMNPSFLDATRMGTVTVAANGTGTVACATTTASSRLFLAYVGGVASGTSVAAPTGITRTAGTGFTFTATANAVYNYLIFS